jgi:hypothetical protein
MDVTAAYRAGRFAADRAGRVGGGARGPAGGSGLAGYNILLAVLVFSQMVLVAALVVLVGSSRWCSGAVPGGAGSSRRRPGRTKLITACHNLRPRSGDDLETRIRIQSLQRLARRARSLTADVRVIEDDLQQLTGEHVPDLLAEPCVGTVTAAQIWISWSHPGRIRSEAAFAALAGTSPLEASSGKRTRHRLNRGGDCHLNWFLRWL